MIISIPGLNEGVDILVSKPDTFADSSLCLVYGSLSTSKLDEGDLLPDRDERFLREESGISLFEDGGSVSLLAVGISSLS